MKKALSRRDFLKIGALALGSLAFNPFPASEDDYTYPAGTLGRVTRDVTIYKEPLWTGGTATGYRHKNDLINIYYEVTPSEGPAYNPVWYRTWAGYVHSGYIQRVKVRLNAPLSSLPETGTLCEVTVPYTGVYQYSSEFGWQHKTNLFYQSTHWAIQVDEGPDGEAWYRLEDELSWERYHVPAAHLRPISDEELSPISPEVLPNDKRIEISLANQTLTAFEGEQAVFYTKISSGLNIQPDPDDTPWSTPPGNYHIESKYPSKHMGSGILANPYGDDLPGVPWTMFFLNPPGYAIHGAYWHNNFGIQMSHGCINMRNEEAKWLYRWANPVFKTPIKGRFDWHQNGWGTRVIVT